VKGEHVRTQAVILQGPRALSVSDVGLAAPGEGDVIVRITHSGISTGTEKLFWEGTMPPFPGMGYPLVPGYESAGEVVEAAPSTGFRTGDRVFVPGANCFGGEARGLFGGAARHLVTPAARVTRIDPALAAEGALLALAATARHAIAGFQTRLPDLIVGHGTLGRLLARLTLAAGGAAPTVWETNPARRDGATGYPVIDPATDTRRDYHAIYDASGAQGLTDILIGRLAKGGELVLAGFYTQPVAFSYAPAFMREARLRIASEWTPDDMVATRQLVEAGALSLSGLITHHAPAAQAARAYETAFTDPSCLKMILDWSAHA
jgi:3-hydroxyethyl bacteriochlorophyllide a dehydrogenase